MLDEKAADTRNGPCNHNPSQINPVFLLTITNILIDNEAKDRVNTKFAASKGQKLRR